ncbi:MAG: hypothetical protein HYR63_17130 [Proteobacteria bacterium]|nr:hypothetical protein [Pseudomonadota bacterium]MBI3499957.1 hypothetical protein [Pseudomonadota bacterium]
MIVQTLRFGLLALSLLLAACQAQEPPPIVEGSRPIASEGDRCGPGVRDDTSVAKAAGLTLDKLRLLRSQHALDNDSVCTMPAKLLARSLNRAEHPKADRPGEWAKFRAMQQADESGTVKPDGLIEALAARTRMLQVPTFASPGGRAAPALAGLDASRWTSIGPNNVPGRVRALAIDPSNASHMIMGGVGGGIWSSSDGGANWRAVNDFSANLAVSHIAFAPGNSSVVYAATGEGFFNVDAIRGAGIFKSTDGGQTWIQLSATNPANDSIWYYVNRLAINPTNNNIVLAATNNGVYRTSDGGVSWTKMTTLRRLIVAIDPNNSNNAIAGGGGSDSGAGTIIYSRDAGATWSSTSVTVVSGGKRVELAYAPATSGLIYASVENNSGEIYKSSDGGATWSLVSSPGHLGNQGWYDNTIWIDPTNSQVVVTAGIDQYRSIDGGANFTKITTWQSWPSSPHADHHLLVSHPSYNGTTNRILFAGNDGGLWKSSDILSANSGSSGNTWSALNTGITTTQLYGGAASADGTRFYAGAQDNGTLVTSGSQGWTQAFGGDGGYAAIDQTDSNYLYGEYVYADVHRSTNGGLSASSICTGITEGGDFDCNGTSQANFIAPFILDPNSQSRLIVGAASLWVTDNAKAATPTWRTIKSPSPTSGNYISAVAVATGNSDLIWVGHNNGAVYYTTNGTATTPSWTLVNVGVSRMVNRILIDPSTSNTVYIAYGGYSSGNLRKTADGGASWTNIATGLPSAPIRGIARNPSNASWLYVGTEVGVFTSETGGSSWSTSNDGPGTVSVDELFFIGSSTTLVAVTHGRGMFKATVDASAGAVSPQTGWWWNSSESGRGFSLEVSGNNIFMSGYLYSSDGTPIWYIGSGARSNNSTFQASLLQYANGQTLAGAFQAATALGSVGTVTLSFDTATTGRLTWAGGTISIQRYNFVSGGVAAGPASGMPQTGWWWNANEPGRGYFFEVQSSTMFMSAYMYDSRGQAAWYISQAAMSSTTLFQGTLQEYRGGQALGGPYQAPSLFAGQGTVTIQFTSTTTATMTLPNGSQISLTRFTF